MAIIYQNPLRDVAKPDQIEETVRVVLDKSSSYQQRHEAMGWLRGALKLIKSRPAVVYIRQALMDGQKLQNEQGGYDVRHDSID